MKSSKDTGLYLAVSFLILGLIAIFLPFNMLDGISLGKFTLKINDYDKLGAFVAGLTAPFLSISAFTLLYLTYKSQKEELADSKIILKSQSETLAKQQFETTFFNLLNLHHSIVNSIDVKIPNSQLQLFIKGGPDRSEIRYGRDCFLTFYKGFTTAYKHTEESNPPSVEGTNIVTLSEIAKIKISYNNFFAKHKYDLGHYFRNLYHIVKFVSKSNITNKQEYVSLLRAQLSTHELLVLFYNGLSDYGKKFKPLIEEYHFLKNMPKEDLLSQDHLREYLASAYGSPDN